MKMAEELFWVDQVVRKIIEREQTLARTDVLRTEMGLGASGVPHVGSAGDGIRSYVVSLALQRRNMDTEFIAFSDDRDGLRKVPANFPSSLEQEIGKPVSLIDDPFGCHESYGVHISSLLTDAFEKLGVVFVLRRSHLEYKKGTLDAQIVKILENHERAGEIIKKITGQDKYTHQLPFMPICGRCGRIYTTRAYKFDGKKIYYKCDVSFTGKNSSSNKSIDIEGCEHESTCSIRDGKLAWKVEFAARWSALRINYEAYGKDILDSVKCNDAIAPQILGYEPPLHSFYEMFTERSGKKISKSAGNVFTPQTWLRYASPASLRLLFLKKLSTTRVVDADVIPALMDETDDLSSIYFDKKKISNATDRAHMKRLYEYIHFLDPPNKPAQTVRYLLLASLLRIAKKKEIVLDILKRTGHLSDVSKEDEEQLMQKMELIENWIEDTEKEERIEYALSDEQKDALKKLVKDLRSRSWDEDALKAHLFEIARNSQLDAKKFFEAAYFAILNNTIGPRLAQLIICLGPARVASIIEENINDD